MGEAKPTIASKVVVRIHKGDMALPKNVFVDGREIKGVTAVDVTYAVGHPRQVRITLYASEVEEVEP
jgi:hypothetical protein